MTSEKAPNDHEAGWRREATKIARSINFGWWFQAVTLPLVIVGTTGACALLLVRRAMPDTPLWQLALAITGGCMLFLLTGDESDSKAGDNHQKDAC